MEKKQIDVSKFGSQLLIGLSESKKSCLNLCSQKWLRPPLSLVSTWIHLGLWHFKILFTEGRITFKNFLACSIQYLKKGKTNFRKKLCFTLNLGILLAFLVLYGLTKVRIILNRYYGDWFLNNLEKQHRLLYHLLFLRVFKPTT